MGRIKKAYVPEKYLDINELTSVIDEKLQDKDIKCLFSKWLEQGEWKQVIVLNGNTGTARQPLMSQRNLLNGLITLLSRFVVNEQGLSWKNYCKMMHNLPPAQSTCPHSLYIVLINNFFKFASLYTNNEEISHYLRKYRYIFLDNELPKKRKNTINFDVEFIQQNIRTNFPLDSLPHQVITTRWDEWNYQAQNFFVKSKNKFVFSLLERFIEDFRRYNSPNKRKAIFQTHNKFYLIFFEESLSGRKIDKFEDFTEGTFRTQLSYYNSLLKVYNFTLDEKSFYSPFLFLIKVYRFLDQVYVEDTGKHLFDTPTFNVELFNAKDYQRLIEEGYQAVVINPLEEFPESDKWMVITEKRLGWLNRKYVSIDFQKVKNDELRNELKKFVWYGIPDDYRGIQYVNAHLTRLLNDAYEFYEATNKLLYINKVTKTKLFSNEFLFTYYKKLMSRTDFTSQTKDALLSEIKKYLRFYQTEYQIPELVFKQMKFLNEKGYQEGSPMSPKDFVVIRETFREMWQGEDELLFIIFQLSITTPMRIGEILALERDCIISSNDKKGIVRFKSKTSDGRYIEEPFLLETIRLIQRAIELSNSAFEKANNNYKKYVFIGFNQNFTKKQVVHLESRYKAYFEEVIGSLYEEGKIEEKYIPYSARDTLINEVYESVENNEISLTEAKTLTLNSPSVVMRSYLSRKRRTKAYMEAFYEIDINEDPVGTILRDEKQSKPFPPVQENAGLCNSEECIKIDLEEDSYYKCLTCGFFITSLERLPVFEERLKFYKEKEESSSSRIKRLFYKGLAELYATYITEMYVMLEENKNDGSF
ncbi:site-specific integrase [Oceanobacillus damuensis]|uniref:hypothetical protein n=1 Tax=Oceanobacillus damuensis TaxID=937928 RepID=UPI00082CAD2E|nr:hypothetical protein [Oceanobacillus damuensis]